MARARHRLRGPAAAERAPLTGRPAESGTRRLAGSETGRPAGPGTGRGSATVLQGGRHKAYRPLPATARAAAFRAGLAAYERGDFFLAHELLEPAWMGTDDLLERELYQGMIKLAAGFVHVARGRPAGATKNLRGARDRLGRVAEAAGSDGGRDPDVGVDLDLPALVAAIDAVLASLEAGTPVERIVAPPVARLARRPDGR